MNSFLGSNNAIVLRMFNGSVASSFSLGEIVDTHGKFRLKDSSTNLMNSFPYWSFLMGSWIMQSFGDIKM